MKFSSASLLAAIVATALAAPAPAPSKAPKPMPTPTPVIGPMGVEIHHSCNATERNQLIQALGDTETLANVALEHVLRYGPEDALYRKYFGNGPTAEVIGWFQKLIYPSNKDGVLLRCDDIDGNCHQDGWAGHWRGDNATQETVICQLSYTERKGLDQMCAFGYEVATHKTNYYFASDLVHRFFHIPRVSELVIDHYTDSYAECLEYAKINGTFAVRNTNSLQFFALDAYAYDVALPGEGCSGKVKPEEDKAEPAPVPPPTSTTSIPPPPPAATSDAPKECHTHADGTEHCV